MGNTAPLPPVWGFVAISGEEQQMKQLLGSQVTQQIQRNFLPIVLL